jgi:hypothetical protein
VDEPTARRRGTANPGRVHHTYVNLPEVFYKSVIMFGEHNSIKVWLMGAYVVFLGTFVHCMNACRFTSLGIKVFFLKLNCFDLYFSGAFGKAHMYVMSHTFCKQVWHIGSDVVRGFLSNIPSQERKPED